MLMRKNFTQTQKTFRHIDSGLEKLTIMVKVETIDDEQMVGNEIKNIKENHKQIHWPDFYTNKIQRPKITWRG